MKPLSLVMQAFGPYRERQEVDFTLLGEKGVYLICGNTGAGKTTLFDAISYALYGKTSGQWRADGMIRSDFASPDSPTFAAFTFSYQQEVYYVRRALRYLRKKRRGEGMIEEKAVAELRLPNGNLVFGVQEVTRTIEELLGINQRQFSQIVMIAQGEFQSFLLCGTAERQEILRRIFDTKKQYQLQEYLRERVNLLSRETAEEKDRFSQYAAQMEWKEETPASAWIESWMETPDIYQGEQLIKELACLMDVQKKHLAWYRKERSEADGVRSGLVRNVEQGRMINQLFLRLEQQRAEHVSLLADVAGREEERGRLVRALLAKERIFPFYQTLCLERESVKALQEGMLEIQEERERQALRTERQREIWEEAAQNRPSLERLAEEIRLLERELPQYRRLSQREASVLEIERRLTQAVQGGRDGEHHLQALQLELGRLERERSVLQEVISGEERLEAETRKREMTLFYLREMEEGIAKVEEGAQELSNLEEEFLQIDGQYNEQSQRLMEEEAKFDRVQVGMLAQTLTEGEACPVCGAIHHPAPATMADNAPSREEMERWRKELSLIIEKRIYMGERRKSLQKSNRAEQERMAQQWQMLYPDVPFQKAILCRRKDEAQEGLLSILQCKDTIRQARKEANAVEGLLTERRKEQTEVLLQTERESALLLALQREKIYETLRMEELKQELSCQGEQEAEEALKEKRKQLQMGESFLLEARRAYEEGERTLAALLVREEERNIQRNNQEDRLSRLEKQYVALLERNDFLDEEAYLLSQLEDETLGELKQKVEDYDNRVAEVTREIARLSEELKGRRPENLDALDMQIKEKDTVISRLDEQIQRMTGRLAVNQKAYGGMADSWERNQKRLVQYEELKALADTANGTLTGKNKMTFETYVQRSLFEQILFAANRRLVSMSSGRFALLCEKEADNRRSQWGLELDVMDHYTGKSRDVRSLSGGESFLASLSLALGLSDVVQRNSGGIQLDSMFLDEGFGSLDEETLSLAIDTLEKIAGGSRLVGIISHVAELRERIERQIRVIRTREGSRVEIR